MRCDAAANPIRRGSATDPPGSWQDRPIPHRSLSAPLLMATPENRRPAWLNWLILAAFLWSSWQLAGMWFQRLHG